MLRMWPSVVDILELQVPKKPFDGQHFVVGLAGEERQNLEVPNDVEGRSNFVSQAVVHHDNVRCSPV